ncbi:WD domain, G-beta repeat protein (macronuclear) [Tetrahymena thermophila SB210]|uniref:WD domain, G-beta repeat protein n=1 Tax=Tetrahymena thermophila (strain SB210) TaxID=312017 RepID=Q23FZ5_TETTS|nr:WD domain, G-beta repeat protein [Tetrahymena thermophila SB210]EAR95465.3 WD domain, G-beta repeat protein [Tetrahymena thermophila SB210]|eukprot:XP_001015710.3 WD domain, G-beta repeat protein [Tetrahymena thermophila SB210]
MDNQFLPPIENISLQRGFKQFNPEKGGSHLLENTNEFDKFPYTCFGYLSFKDKNTNKKKLIGQAVLIGPSHILTSANSIYDFTKQYESLFSQGELEFYGGIDLDIQTKVVSIYCNKETIKASKSYDQQNFAMCILEKNIGEKLGYLGIITPLQMALFEEIQFKQQPVLVFDSQQLLSGQICDVDDKEMLIQFKNSDGVIINQIDQEYHSIQEQSLEKNQESVDDEQEEQERDQEQMRMEIIKNNAQATSQLLNNIVFIHDKLFGYAILSADAQRDGIYYKSQYLTCFHLYQMVFWYQGLEVNQKDQTQKIQEMKYLENKGNMKVEEPAEQENKPLVCLKQLNNQFIFTGNEDSSANFWHLGSMNIGQSVQKEVFEYNFRDSTFNGIADIVSEGYYAVAIVGRYAILLNWLNFELLEAKQFDYDLTCIIKRQQRFKYLVGDAQGQVIYLNLNCNTLQLEEDQEGSLRSRQQKNMHGHKNTIEKLCLIPERNQLVVASSDGIRIWDVKSKKLVTNIESEQKKAVTFIGYSKTRLYIAGEDQYLKIYDLSGKQQKSMRFQYPIKCGVFLNSSEIALSDGKNLKIINVITNAQDYYSIHKNNITHICKINEFQFITADTRGSLYKWTLMSNESESSLQYRVSVELSKAAKVNFSDYSPEKVAKFFQSNQSPNTSSFHSQKFLQMKAKIETQRNLANQGIYEGSQKMVGDLYSQENYYLKAKVRNLESKVNAAKGEYSESHKDFINNSSYSKLNASSINNNSSTRNLRENSSSITLKTQKAQIKVMEQKLKEQEDLVLKIQGEEQLLRNNAEKKVKQEKKVYMEKNVDDIKKNSQRFESMIPLIQNDIDLLRKQLSFMNEKLSDKQERIRDRSSSLQKKQSELKQFHNQIQKREQDVQEELNKKREQTKQQQEQDKREMEQQRQQFNEFIKVDQDHVQEDGDEDDNQALHDNQFEHISQELDQTIKNSQNFINSQRNLNSSLQQYVQANIDESNESNMKASQISSKNRNDEINNSLGSSCVLNNKKITSSAQARNIMKSNREEQSFQNQQEMSQNISNSSRNNYKNQISNIEEEQNSYKYTNRKSSPSNYGNSQIISETNEKLSHRNKIEIRKAADQEGQNTEQTEENLKYSFIEQQFFKLQQQVAQLQQNYEEIKQSNYSPSKLQTIIIPQQSQFIRPSEFKPVLRIQQNVQGSSSNQIYNTPESPNQLQSALRINNFVGYNQNMQPQQSSNIAQNSPPKPYFGTSATTRSLSPNLIANNSGQTYNQMSQFGNSQNLQLNSSSQFYINNSPQKGYDQQILQKSQIHQSPGQILLLNNSLNQSLCEGISSSNTKQKTAEQVNNKSIQGATSSSQQKQRPSSSLKQNQLQLELMNQSKNTNQFNIYKMSSPAVQNISQLNQLLAANTSSINNPSLQQTDFIQQQKLLLQQQQQQLMQQQNPLQTTQFQNNIQANNEINYENEQNQIADIQKERKISSRQSKQSIISNNQNISMEVTQVKQLQEENLSLKKKLQEHSKLIQELQQIMQNQSEENSKQQEISLSEKENFKAQYQKLVEQSNAQQQNIQQISEQIVKQTQYINQLEQEKQTQLFSYNEMAKQFDREKNQMVNQINLKELEIQQKNSEILQCQNSISQLNITIQQLRQMTTYEEVEKLTKQINVMDKMIEQQKNESKTQKQLLMGQEKAIVDGKRIELEFQQIQLLNQQLSNENGILKSRMQFLEAENKQLNQKMLVIRDEIDGKYQNTILELQKLMQGHANKQINITQSVENIKQGVLNGLDINALDKLIEISHKKQQLSTTQNLKQSVSSIPISQVQGMQQQNIINQSYQPMRITDQLVGSTNYEQQKTYQKRINYNQEQQLVNLESTSSIKTFNPDDQRSVQEQGTMNAQQGRFQSRSVSPLGLNSRGQGQGFNSSQQKSLRSDRSNKKFDSESIKTFQPDGLEVSRSDENSDSDYLSNMSNLQITNQDQYPLNKKSSLKTSKTIIKQGNNKQQVVLVDENDIQQKKRQEEQGMCAQQ